LPKDDAPAPERAAFYFDGFNFYHAIDNLGEPYLKWLNLWELAAHLIPRKSQKIVQVVWCTAIKTDDSAKQLRYRALERALTSVGVTRLNGHFITEAHNCRECGREWRVSVEKQGDVNLALALIDDAHRDIFDHAYLVTADSDQAATARLFAERFPAKTLTSVAPPMRPHSKNILAYTRRTVVINKGHLESCLFPRAVMKDGAVAAIRPKEYDPPAGWVPPRLRKS
jgi:hypothetical protein